MDDDAADASWDFDIDRRTAEAWDTFAAKLAEVVSVMDAGATLTVGAATTEGDGRPPFVRFTAGESGRLVAEASGNGQLGEHFRLSDAQLAALASAGWGSAGPDAPLRYEGTQEAPENLAAHAVAALRDVFGVPHPAFLAPDQLAEILTPAAVAEPPLARPAFDPAEAIATLPSSRADLDALVKTQLTAWLGYVPVADADGDFGIRVGSTMVFVRTSPDAREVLVFASLVHDVEGRSRAMEVLSDLNADARFVRFLLLRDRVFVSMSVLARPFVAAHLRQALELVSVTSDAIDDELAAKLRGRTTFTDEDR